MLKWLVIGVIVFLVLFLLCSSLAGVYHKKDLTVQAFGMDILKVICFDPVSGRTIWDGGLEQIKQKSFSVNDSAICLGPFWNSKSRAVSVLKFNSANNVLANDLARHVNECDCNLHGEVLSAFRQYAEYGKI